MTFHVDDPEEIVQAGVDNITPLLGMVMLLGFGVQLEGESPWPNIALALGFFVFSHIAIFVQDHFRIKRHRAAKKKYRTSFLKRQPGKSIRCAEFRNPPIQLDIEWKRTKMRWPVLIPMKLRRAVYREIPRKVS
jgi:hypothetical protein